MGEELEKAKAYIESLEATAVRYHERAEEAERKLEEYEKGWTDHVCSDYANSSRCTALIEIKRELEKERDLLAKTVDELRGAFVKAVIHFDAGKGALAKMEWVKSLSPTNQKARDGGRG